MITESKYSRYFKQSCPPSLFLLAGWHHRPLLRVAVHEEEEEEEEEEEGGQVESWVSESVGGAEHA